jgi:hypothetical protein
MRNNTVRKCIASAALAILASNAGAALVTMPPEDTLPAKLVELTIAPQQATVLEGQST